MATKRSYVQRARAERQLETRRRITEAAIGLHLDVGPAATQVSDVARRAGVQRATLYNHFPDEQALVAACSAHWRALHPAPDPALWLAIEDRALRARILLADLYGWYRETAPMTANVLRDAQVMPTLHSVISAGLLPYLDGVVETLAAPFRTSGRHAQRVDRAARAVSSLAFWQALEPLGDREAAELGAGLMDLAGAR